MNDLELKQRIHNKIEVSDKKVLEAIYTLLENLIKEEIDSLAIEKLIKR